MNVTILGAGAWGTALAVHASTEHATRLWARDPEQVKRLRAMSPLYEMVQEGIDLKSIAWTAH